MSSKKWSLYFLLFFKFCIWNSSAFAQQQKITLLISLDPQKLCNSIFSCSKKDYISALEDIFLKQFSKSHYEIEIHNFADQRDLWTALHDPQNVAVFWLSHAGAAKNRRGEPSELMTVGQVSDASGFAVSPVFTKIHPNLRFLGVIGCNTTDTLKRFHFPPDLTVYANNKKVDAKRGLKSAIKKSLDTLQKAEIRAGYISECPDKQTGYSIRIQRFFSSNKSIRPAARVLAGENVLGVFPGVQNTGVIGQEQKFFVPQKEGDIKSLPDLRIDVGTNAIFQADKTLMNMLDIGNLNFILTDNAKQDLRIWGPWDLWTAQSGIPIGLFLNIYKTNAIKLGGTLQQFGDLSRFQSEYSEFQCAPMPAY